MELISVCRTFLQSLIRPRLRTEAGASLVEYALVLVLIGIFCIGAVTLVGTSTSARLSSSASQVQ